MNDYREIRLTHSQITGVMETLHKALAEDDEQLKLDMIEGETNLHELVRAMLDENERDQSFIEALDEQIADRSARKERFELRIEARRNAICRLMDSAMLTRLLLPEATLSMRTIAPRPKVLEPRDLPDEFVTLVMTRKPNIAAIKEAVARNESIPGVIMTNGSTSLTVRRK